MVGTVIGPIEINGTLVPQITQHSIDPQVQEFAIGSGGSADVSFLANMQETPVLSFTSTAVKTVLDLVAVGVLAVGTVVNQYFAHLATTASGRAASAAHTKLTINDGLIVCRTIEAQHNQPATITVEIYATYDGTNNPFVKAVANTALPSSSLAAVELFTLGPVKIGSTLIDTQSVSLDPGITVFLLGKSGEPWNRLAAMNKRKVRATVTSLDPALLTAVGEVGGSQTSPIVFLQKVDKNATRVAAATAEHIGFTFPKGFAYPGPMGGSEGSVATYQAMLCPADEDGTNAPVTLDTTMAIA